ESEHVAVSGCCAQVLSMRTQLTDYGFFYDKVPIYYDSKSAIAISCNPVQHTRTKHIDVRTGIDLPQSLPSLLGKLGLGSSSRLKFRSRLLKFQVAQKKVKIAFENAGSSSRVELIPSKIKAKPVVHRPYRPLQRPVRTNMNGARPNRTSFNKQAHSYANRPFYRTLAVRSHYRAPWVPTLNRSFSPVNRKLSTGSRNFPTANRKFPTASRKFPTASRKFPTGSTKCSTDDMGMKGKAIKPSACWFWKPS
nr:uncharacterized mitochondrial protein AtMg00810-like [Tanacetum cinerariifolium]